MDLRANTNYDLRVADTNDFIQVNQATTACGKKLASYAYTDKSGNEVDSEAVTLTSGEGLELLGAMPSASSVPVVLATDQLPIPITSTVTNALNLPEPVVVTNAAAVAVLVDNPLRGWATVQNLGGTNIRVGDVTVSPTTGIRLSPNATFTFQNPNVYQGAIYAIAETATDSEAIGLEGVLA